MEPQRRRDQIDERRLVADFLSAKQLRSSDVSATPMRFDAPPVVRALQDVFAILPNLQLDNYQAAVLPERERGNGKSDTAPTAP